MTKSKRSKKSKDSRPVIVLPPVKMIPRSKIKEAPYNPRVPMKPGDGEWEKLKASLLAFGQAIPLVWNIKSGNLVAGHQTLRVIDAEFDNPNGKLRCSVVNLNKRNESALNLALNKIDGWWDLEKVAIELAKLKVSKTDESLSGFDEAEIDKLIADWVKEELDLEPVLNPEELVTDVKLEDRGATVSITLGPDVVKQLDKDAKKNGSSRAGVGRTIIEQWAKRRIKSDKKTRGKRSKN